MRHGEGSKECVQNDATNPMLVRLAGLSLSALTGVNWAVPVRTDGCWFSRAVPVRTDGFILTVPLALRPLRCVVLIALRDVSQGEELLSNYYTIVR